MSKQKSNDSLYTKPLSPQEIVENHETHIMLIPRSEEDQAYIEKLESSVVKNMSDDVILKEFEEYIELHHQHASGQMTIGGSVIEHLYELKTAPLTSDEKLNLLCNCHNCDTFFPLRNLKWVETVTNIESYDHNVDGHAENFKNDEEYGIIPMCAKYPICPSSWSCFDIQVLNKQYSLADHKNGKYNHSKKK